VQHVVFLDMADRMVPSLSRDRKWPRLTKYTYSRVVCLRLEGNLVVSVICSKTTELFMSLRYRKLFLIYKLIYKLARDR